MRRLTSSARLILSLCLACLASAQATAQPDPRLIFFGDSLTDPGNYFIEFGVVSEAPFAPDPSAPYTIGGHHFSNGATWAEDITEILHDPPSGKPALRAPRLFTNYAVGRARARAGAPVFSAVDLSTEVGLFMADFGNHAPTDATYVIWIGANDLQDALNALASDPSGATSVGIIARAVTAVADNIGLLWGKGARTFLVPNEPDLALTPLVRSLGPQAEAAATFLTGAYNDAIDEALGELQVLPDIQFRRFNVNSLFHQVVATPARFGLSDVQHPCLSFGDTAHFICAQPNRHLFWDGVHPTRAVHEILAEFVARDIFAAAAPAQTNAVE